jgi:methionyl-tRNA formyltransferase
VFLERRVAIDPDETSGELLARLAPIGAEALLEVVAAIAAGTARAEAQDHARASHAKMLDKADGMVDFAQLASAVAARIRGVDPWPGAQAVLRGQVLKLFRARSAMATASAAAAAPGTVLAIDAAGVHVAAAGGTVTIHEVQAAGRKRMTAAQFAAGRGIAVGDVLSRPEPA